MTKIKLFNASDVGTINEQIFANFLRRHVPSRCEVIKGGYVIDSCGNRSKQIDLLINNDLGLNFKKFDEPIPKTFCFVESVYSAISIKSFLDKDSLIDSLENLKSISKNKEITVSPVISNKDSVLSSFPLKIIFAYNGIDIRTIKIHLDEYYENNNIEIDSLPDIILVNRKFFLSKIPLGGYQDERGFFTEGTYLERNKGKFIGGIGLMHLLARIQKVSSLAPHILFNSDKYYVNLKIAEEKLLDKNEN